MKSTTNLQFFKLILPAQNLFEPSQNVGYLLLFFVDTLRKIQLQSEIKMKKTDNYIFFSKSFTFDSDEDEELKATDD